MSKIDEYTKKFFDEAHSSAAEDEGRQETLNELSAFIDMMRDRPLAGVTLDANQSTQWDDTSGIDYQNQYGQQIISQVSRDGETEAVVIQNAAFLPVALAFREESGAWAGIGVDERLREVVAQMLEEKLG
jgi:hypothetical protein